MSHLLQERTSLAKLPRDELEDRYYRMQEDNLSLKKQINTKDDKLKKYEWFPPFAMEPLGTLFTPPQ